MAWNPNIPTVTNRVQDDLNAIRENFQHLDPLAQYVQALLDSRIVDHNLDVADPPNGWYVRWENGLQACFRDATIDLSTGLFQNKPMPAAFVGAAYGGGSPEPKLEAGNSAWWNRLEHIVVCIDESHWRLLVRTNHFEVTGMMYLFAIGRWK